MLLFVLFSLVFSKNNFNLMKYSQLLITPDMSQSEVDEAFNKMKENIVQECTSDEAKYLEDEEDDQYWIDYCIASLEAMQQVKVSDGNNVNDVLKEFKENNEFIIIIGMPKIAIDFGNLKAEMIVSVNYEEKIEMSKQLSEEDKYQKYKKMLMKNVKKMAKAHVDGSHKSVMKYINLQSKKPKTGDYGDIEIVGDVKGKVSFLICINCLLKISGSDLNVPYMYMYDSKLHQDSLNIKSNHFIVDPQTQVYISDVVKDKIHVNQYGIMLGYYGSIENIYQIVYQTDSWGLKYSTGGTYNTLFNSAPVKIYYSSASIFNILVYAYHIDINLEQDVKLEKYSPLNLTLIESFSTSPNEAKILEEKDKVQITASGWDEVAKEDRPNIVLSLDSESFEFTKTEEDPFNVEQQELYTYKPNPSDDKKKTNVGMIVGIVVACVVVVVVVIVVVVIVVRKKKVGNSSNE